MQFKAVALSKSNPIGDVAGGMAASVFANLISVFKTLNMTSKYFRKKIDYCAIIIFFRLSFCIFCWAVISR